MVEIVELTKHYASPDGETVRAIDGVTMSVDAGEIIALYGPSGSGKTTLLNIIAGLMRPDGGRVAVRGRDVTNMRARDADVYRLTEVGFIQQTPEFVAGSAIDNAAFKLLGRYRLPKARAAVVDLMGELGLGDRLHHRPDELSGGERQRVMIARALAIRPAVVLADEPTGNLDRRRSGEVLALIRRLSHDRGVATILVTHDPLAAEYADRVLELVDGRVRPFRTTASA
ncbi:ABC transporter ATP-binding protein [Conexibacter stalactiti]|uniref:ABC transporter ATP-binding protein n=1 Tax=Conexibacter stalactiti TaxID=1940611 RepID=A0ABU4HJI9_9ACTN|nr:ABC transporter ATP-binding protein [Conexibacter stalactiti]MDW5593471.1 ABC transporter ATP-binding protein [Conexibacter stalactiti]MEC5034112.1 ABC transporter ATP-binding protein [Conexibacter stalactiti]